MRVVFADGEVRDVDIEPLLGGPLFTALRDPALFAKVEVDEFAQPVVWPDGPDLNPEVVYGTAEPATGPAPRVSAPNRV